MQRLKRWAPAGVFVSGSVLVLLGGRSWAAEVPAIAALGWAVAAAGLLAWFVGAVLRRIVGAVAAGLLLLALVIAVAAGSGPGMVAAAAVAALGLVFAAVLVLRAQASRPDGATASRVDPWTALDRGEDPTAGPAANEQPT